MLKKQFFIFGLFLASSGITAQTSDQYEIYALRYAKSEYAKVRDIAVGANSNDSITACNMFWVLKGNNGRIVLIDAGDLDSVHRNDYIRPDRLLKQINLNVSDITDIIITHPHFDHVGAIDFFPAGKVWMQKKDYDYFVDDAWQKDGFHSGFDKNNVRSILEMNLNGRLNLVNGDSIEIIPGIKVFTGSKHTWENQYLLVSGRKENVLLASDAIWFYYNLDNMLPIPTFVFDEKAYVKAMKRMTTLVRNPEMIIPGHDSAIFNKFPRLTERVVIIN
jgi:glyoxylase-like metal-dependent hydrolase (beta-lactamase superfamily II)